jgi:hypothetical protein
VDIPVAEIFRQTNAFIEVVMPVWGIVSGLSIALGLFFFIVRAIARVIEAKFTIDSMNLQAYIWGNLDNLAERLQKRKALDHEYPEYPALELGLERETDGELVELDTHEQEVIQKR